MKLVTTKIDAANGVLKELEKELQNSKFTDLIILRMYRGGREDGYSIVLVPEDLCIDWALFRSNDKIIVYVRGGGYKSHEFFKIDVYAEAARFICNTLENFICQNQENNNKRDLTKS